jgi:hypothetical protein
MDDVQYWTKVFKKAEREFEAATTCTALSAAAKRLMLAKTGTQTPRSPYSRSAGAY